MNLALIAKLEMYAAILAVVGFAILGSYWWGHHNGFEEEKTAYDKFVGQTEQAGKDAEIAKTKKEKDNAEAITAAQNDATTARNQLIDWMRQHPNTSGRVLPGYTKPIAGSDRTGQSCYDDAQLDAALRQFLGNIQGIIADGQTAVIDRHQVLSGWPK